MAIFGAVFGAIILLLLRQYLNALVFLGICAAAFDVQRTDVSQVELVNA